MSIIDKIPSLSDDELLNLFNNALNLIDKGKNIEKAHQVIGAIQIEWKARYEKYKNKMYVADRPQKGILSSLGYAVGENGVSTKRRRQILEYILTGVLPFTGSPAYMAEWGDENSARRYNKLRSVLNSLIVSNKNKNMHKAIIEWSEDLDYLHKRNKKN